ncbi:hypothetical protein HYR99_41450 [Candidatus Poribacteria bacterium]|nr:hypothetical protein [Candidatus Poribacteria bacterium]
MSPKQMSPNKTKSEKLGFNQFLVDLGNALSGKNKGDSIPVVYKLIKKGFKEKVENHHVEEIWNKILNWDHLPRLAMKVAVEVNFSEKPPPLMRRLLYKMRQEIARRADFPFSSFPEIPDLKRKSVLEHWIKHDSVNEVLDLNWARNAIICLINEKITEDDFNLIHLIVKKCAEKRGDQPNGKYADYIKPVGNFFSAQDLSKSKILNWLAPLLIFDEKTKVLASKASNLELQLHQSRWESTDLRTELKKTRHELEEARAKVQNLEKEVEFKEHSLAAEKERFEMLDEHWKRKCADELAGQAYSFKKYFAHELQGAKIALGAVHGTVPDVEMALSRIKHMEDYLAKNGGSV